MTERRLSTANIEDAVLQVRCERIRSDGGRAGQSAAHENVQKECAEQGAEVKEGGFKECGECVDGRHDREEEGMERLSEVADILGQLLRVGRTCRMSRFKLRSSHGTNLSFFSGAQDRPPSRDKELAYLNRILFVQVCWQLSWMDVPSCKTSALTARGL